MTARVSAIAILFVVFGCSRLCAQGRQLPPALGTAYESFEYAEAIRLADSVLTAGDSLPVPLRVDCYLVRGLAQYSLGEEEAARKSFLEILVLKEDYRPDSIRVSPKIIRFFNSVKDDYDRVAARGRPGAVVLRDSVPQPVLRTADRDGRTRSALVRSLVLPGWGHLTLSHDTKGWILASLGAATLGSMVASIVVTASRERTYLGASDPALIASAYDRYNAAYRVRNGLIAAYVVLYAYAQIDLLFISGAEDPDRTTLSLEGGSAGDDPLRLTFRVPF